jgi:hypothetical protein
VRADDVHVRKLRVAVPEPVSVPVVIEYPPAGP